MSKAPLANMALITLRGGATIGTALTATDAHVLATDLKDARIEACMSGILIANVETADDGDGNETYVLALIGRESDTDTYTDLATITVTRGVVGTYATSIPKFDAQLNYSLDNGVSTTPSINFALTAVATELRYAPDVGTVITA